MKEAVRRSRQGASEGHGRGCEAEQVRGMGVNGRGCEEEQVRGMGVHGRGCEEGQVRSR